MVRIELLNEHNEEYLRKIDRSDIPFSFVEPIEDTIELAKWGTENGLKGGCYGILVDNRYVGILLIGEGMEGEVDPPEVKGKPFYRVIGFVLDRNYRGAGIGSEALKLAIADTFEHYGKYPVLLECQRENARAAAFYERNGFKSLGYGHDDDIWMILRAALL